MKKIYIGILCFLIIGCNPEKRLVDKSSHLIEKLFQTTDTIYECYVAFDDRRLIWYHDSTTLNGFIVKLYSTQKLHPVYCASIR